MFRNLQFLLVLVSAVALYCDSQKTGHDPKRPKPTRTPGVCPDTCALKRRIGKVEVRFRDDLNQAKELWSDEVATLRNDSLRQNPSSASEGSLNDESLASLKREIAENVDEKLNAAIETLRGRMEGNYDQLKSALSQLTDQSKVQSMSQPEDGTTENSQHETHLVTTINFLNITLTALRRQNNNLLQQTQEIRSQTSVLRAQNEALADDNEKLRSLVHGQKVLGAESDRILELEDKLSQHDTTMNSLRSQIEWMGSRIDQLSGVVDRAQTESASAAEKANRATAMARKAISVARRQPAPTESSEDHTPSDGLRQPDTPPNDCWELLLMGYNVSGVYRIRPDRAPEAFEVFCEQSYAGGGWTLVQRRRDGTVSFDRNWREYSTGFGSPDGEMWLGNQKMFFLTNQNTYTLQVLLLDWEGNRAFAEYAGFRVQSDRDNHAIQFGRYVRGNAGDALRGSVRDGSRNAYLAHFTTKDFDNDSCQPCMIDRDAFENCADINGGGWWFRACTDSNLNGRYIQQRDFGECGDVCYGIQWKTWKRDPNYSLKASLMLVKPIDTYQ